jgi:predicted DNA-binding protein (MmcQ/YjbR family)
MDLERLQMLCKTLPAVSEDIKWDNDLCFSVGGKMFCVSSLEFPLHISFKVKDEEFEELCACEGFISAPYMARAKWVSVTNSSMLNQKEWNFYITQSYNLVKARLTKKLRAELGLT